MPTSSKIKKMELHNVIETLRKTKRIGDKPFSFDMCQCKKVGAEWN